MFRLTRAAAHALQGAVRAVIAQRRLQVLVEQIQAGKLEPKSLIATQDDGIRWADPGSCCQGWVPGGKRHALARFIHAR